jgi:PAS domain S-box-containing protein
VALFLVSQPTWWRTESEALWFPSVGLGLVIVAWLGWRGLLTAAATLLLLRLALAPRENAFLTALDVLLLAGELAAGWVCYHTLGRGSRRVNDPRSATTFLLIVPGAVAAVAALARAGLIGADSYWPMVRHLWLGHAVGFLTLAPPLLLIGTPLLTRAGLLRPGSGEEDENWIDLYDRNTPGDYLELGGLALGAVLLGQLLTASHLTEQVVNWHLWGILLLVVVWASLRQGLRGGSLAAAAAALSALPVVVPAAATTPAFVALQGNLLSLASTALLVGASSGWIRASELRYRQVVGHIPVVLYSARVRQPAVRGKPPQAHVLLVSAACRQIFACAPADLLGDYDIWLQHVHPEDRELVIAALVQMVRRQGPVRCEYRLNPELVPPITDSERARSAGTPLPQPLHPVASLPSRDRWVRDLLAPNYDGDGVLLGWEGVVEDITTQRGLAHDLQRTSTMLHTLVANLPAGVFFVQGPMGLPLLVNMRARQLLGQREDPSAGLTHLPRVYRLHRPDGTVYPWEELPVYKALHLGITSMRDDIVVHRPDGRHVPLVTWAAPIDLGSGGQIEAAVWVFEDLTALHQAEAARLESETRLRAIIETMAEGLLIQDRDGVILECNPAAGAILGQTPAQLCGRTALGPDLGWQHEDGTPFPREGHPDVVSRRTRQPVRNVVAGIPYPSAEGATAVRWILINCVPLTTGQTGRPGFQERTIITLADITASRQMLTELERVQRLEVAARLASGFVHDFNNLLTAILCLAQMAKTGLPSDHPLLPDLDTIESAAEEAGRLAAQLLAFSKQRRTTFRPVDPNQVVERTLQLLESSLPDNITVEVNLSAVPASVLADEGQLQQVVMNLCLNARDAMPQGGRLVVETAVEQGGSRVEDRSQKEAAGAPQSWVRLTVRDTGQGMDRDLQARIFDPFFSTKERGTGLGLAVVRHLVIGFRGHIDLWSEPGQGTRFDIRLPLCSPDLAPGALAGPQSPGV